MSNNNYNYFPIETKKKKRKIPWGVIAAVAAVLVIAALIPFMFKKAPDYDEIHKDETSTTSVSLSESESESKIENQLTQAPNSNQNSNHNHHNNCKPNSHRLSKGCAVKTSLYNISFTSCNTDFKDYEVLNDFMKPKDGNKVICTEFIFENISSEQHYPADFSCYADDFECSEFIVMDNDSMMSRGFIDPGRKSKIKLYYEVPKNAKDIEIEFKDPSMREGKITFDIK